MEPGLIWRYNQLMILNRALFRRYLGFIGFILGAVLTAAGLSTYFMEYVDTAMAGPVLIVTGIAMAVLGWWGYSSVKTGKK